MPYDSHSYLFSLVSGTLPVFIEIGKRSARFISSCVNSKSILVQSVAIGMVYLLCSLLAVCWAKCLIFL
jgi:hypothetical protein